MESAALTRIAFVITGLAPGGAERCLVNVALGLAARGEFVPAIISLQPRPTGDQAVLVERLERAIIPVHFLDAANTWDAPSVISQLTALLAKFQPRVVQTFLFHANVLGALAAWRAGVGPTIAGVRVAEPSWWRPRVEATIRPLVSRWVCVSQRVAEFARSAIGVPPEQIEVIPNGIELASYSAEHPHTPADLGLAPGRRALGFVGRLEPQKGLDWLFSCLPQILARLPEHDLVVVGNGSQESMLRERASQADLARRVHFLGWRGDLPALLPACDVVLLPSRYEGMSNVLLEAMACARPVVATDVEGIAEVLGSLGEEQIVEPNDSAEFAERVVRLAADRTLATELGAANRARIAKHFSLTGMVATYARLYAAADAKAAP